MEKVTEHEDDRNRCTRYSHQRIVIGNGGIGNKRMSGDYTNFSIIKIGRNTEKSPEDWRRFVVTQISSERPSANACVKNSQKNIK